MNDLPKTLTQSLVKELLLYNENTGLLIWKKRDRKYFIDKRSFNTWNARFYENEAGGIYTNDSAKTSYKKVRLLNVDYGCHNIAYLYVNGIYTTIDHIDGNGLNNQISNLRPANHFINSRNMPMQENNTSGVVGVAKYIKTNKYQAYINNNKGKQIHLGLLSSIEGAIAARKDAEIKYGYHKNHGRVSL